MNFHIFNRPTASNISKPVYTENTRNSKTSSPVLEKPANNQTIGQPAEPKADNRDDQILRQQVTIKPVETQNVTPASNAAATALPDKTEAPAPKRFGSRFLNLFRSDPNQPKTTFGNIKQSPATRAVLGTGYLAGVAMLIGGAVTANLPIMFSGLALMVACQASWKD